MKKLALVSVLSLFILVGCTNESGNNPGSSDEKMNETPSVEESIDQGNKEESLEETSNNSNSDVANNNEKTPNKNGNESTNNSSQQVKTEEFKIYGFDKNVEFKEVVGTVNIDKGLSKEEKLNVLFNEISKNYGDKFKMEIKLNANNIVELNILNVDEIKGNLTSSAQVEGFIFTFIDSLLQKEYTGDWISGVQVLNNGEVDNELGEGVFAEVYKR